NLAHISQILNSFTHFAGLPGAPNTTSASMSKKASMNTPPMNTPTKLSRFLQYVEKDLRMQGLVFLEDRFCDKGYGPDILHLVDNTELQAMGLADGDVIRLKQNTPLWWNGPNAKRKQSDTPLLPMQDYPSTPPNKKMAFEKRFNNNTGGGRYYSPRMTPGQLPPGQDFVWHYYCKGHHQMVPLPDGWVPVHKDGEHQSDEEF
ncbi:hypothetical protein BDZ94DRAFT_1177933, partial [Collybia nuda]